MGEVGNHGLERLHEQPGTLPALPDIPSSPRHSVEPAGSASAADFPCWARCQALRVRFGGCQCGWG